MTADREYIIKRLQTTTMTSDMFMFEKLSCPYSLSQLFSYDDPWKIYEIANSVKYASKPVQKANEIDMLMKSRGFEKLQAGTNRVCYKFIEDNSFVVKIPYNAIGLRDNPDEYKNQKQLKPFCTKVFECTPNGAIASFERVRGIKNRYEYYSMYPEIYKTINDIIKNGFIMEDIGTNYFMNIGIREGFGPVLLDFSFLYIPDGNKLYCSKPDINSYTGLCEGEIDYDPGYNFLYCTKCGTKYKAVELARRMERDVKYFKRTRRTGGHFKMKMTFNGGDKGCKNEVVTNSNGFINSIPTNVTVKQVEAKRVNNNSVKVTINSAKADLKEVVAARKEKTTGEVIAEPGPIIKPREEAEVVTESINTPVVEEVLDKSDGINPVEMVTIDTFRDKLLVLVDEYKFLKNSGENPEKVVDEFITSIEDPDLIKAVSYIANADEYSEFYDVDDEAIEEASTTTTDDAAAESTHEYDKDISRFEAVVVDIHDVVNDIPSEPVLLIKNVGSEGYITVGDNQLFAIDMIDGAFLSSLSIVAKDYLNNLETEVSKYENLEVKEAPIGV